MNPHNSGTQTLLELLVDVGAVLPDDGVTYYEVPSEYDVPVYKYAIVNGQTVLVDPRSHRIVQIID